MLQFLALQIGIVVSCYFDDFIVLSVPEMAEATEKAFSALLDFVGFAYDKTGPKADSMSSMVTALGVVFDFTESSAGTLRVKNTDKRVEEVTAMIQETVAGKFLTPSAAATLKGRLGFAEGQLFGRTARRLINDLGSFAASAKRRAEITEGLIVSLNSVAQMLRSGRPREIDSRSHEVLFLYTDACFSPEEGNGGIGGVLCAADGTVISWFGEELTVQFAADSKPRVRVN